MHSAGEEIIVIFIQIVGEFLLEVILLEVIIKVVVEILAEIVAKVFTECFQFFEQVARPTFQPSKLVKIVGVLFIIHAVAVEIVPLLAVVVRDIDLDRMRADDLQLHATVRTDNALPQAHPAYKIQFGVTLDA